MIGAIAAAGIWSFSIMSSARGAGHLGGISANLVRLSLALPLLALAAAVAGTAPLEAARSPAGWWFLGSGLLGMGVCDILVLTAYPRLGARVTALVVNASAAPAAALIGWAALGEHPNGRQGLAMVAVLAGMALVLRPRRGDRFDLLGTCCAFAGAATFAGSAVMSRHGFSVGAGQGVPVHWLDSTLLRVAAGVALSLAAFAAASWLAPSWRDGPGRWRQAVPWLALNALLGPGIGLVCYQWALTTTPAAQVHAVVAAIPVLVLVWSWLLGEQRPDRLSVLGTLVAVGGVIALALLSRT